MNIFQVNETYQYQMESKYQEQTNQTNLFTENKFIVCLGLFINYFFNFCNYNFSISTVGKQRQI